MSKRYHQEMRMDGSNRPGRAVLNTEGTEGTEEMKAKTRLPSSFPVPPVPFVVKGLNCRANLQPRSANTAYTLGYGPFHFSPWNERDTTCI